MKIIKTSLEDVFLIEPKVYLDDRGFFLETFHENSYNQLGISHKFVQDNHSGSVQGTLRGLHYQIKQPQGKLVHVIRGTIYDVAIDIRKNSQTLGKHVGVELSEENKLQLWIPPGFAHGFYVLSEWAEIIYKTTDYYAPEWERTILWNDPVLNITWPLLEGISFQISEKDANAKLFSESELMEVE
ncbi:MAG: dTDP-4-dehydrorhamnose 3,5-epimerase [Candidatus Heimdallarchaeota archaeon]|nr:dTDP-4-dehydrorhamnose 3,5-epimerase [Candidatus Heimdallarchaeota archaeon]